MNQLKGKMLLVGKILTVSLIIGLVITLEQSLYMKISGVIWGETSSGVITVEELLNSVKNLDKLMIQSIFDLDFLSLKNMFNNTMIASAFLIFITTCTEFGLREKTTFKTN